ncbi:MAG: hypothetical protein IPJ71_19265 [Bdellovibrionales bacterium]|nr:hypothetical protein [Bdellovibrionales bacterium]
MKYFLLVCLLWSIPLMAQQGETSSDDVASFINKIKEQDAGNKTTSFKTVDEAIQYLSQFPQQRQTVVHSLDDASKLCDGFFQGWFFWWECKTDIIQKVIPQSVLEYSVSLSRGEDYRLVYGALTQASNHYIDEQAFRVFAYFISPQYIEQLIILIRDSYFEASLSPLCSSRASSIGNAINPISSARRLRFNQEHMFRCIATIRNKKITSRNMAPVFLCRAKLDVFSRTTCLAKALGDQ